MTEFQPHCHPSRHLFPSMLIFAVLLGSVITPSDAVLAATPDEIAHYFGVALGDYQDYQVRMKRMILSEHDECTEIDSVTFEVPTYVVTEDLQGNISTAWYQVDGAQLGVRQLQSTEDGTITFDGPLTFGVYPLEGKTNYVSQSAGHVQGISFAAVMTVKVANMKPVTVAAGIFDAFAVKYKLVISVPGTNRRGTLKWKIWVSPNVGPVKTKVAGQSSELVGYGTGSPGP